MEIRGLKRPLLVNKDYFRERGEPVVISRDDTPLDRGRDRTRGQHMAVTCFYFDFAALQEQTATSLLGSILKLMISGTEKVPEDIWRALQEPKKAVAVFRTVQGPHRDGGDDAKKTGRNTTGRDR